MNNTKENATAGFVSLLTVAFIVLKLCGVIHWEWIWVLSPLWIPIASAFVILAVIYAYVTIYAWFSSLGKDKEEK